MGSHARRLRPPCASATQRRLSAASVRIVEFAPRWRDDFARLNLEWLQRWFAVEPIDREVLGDPETHILQRGGHVLFAIDVGRPEQSILARSEPLRRPQLFPNPVPA